MTTIGPIFSAKAICSSGVRFWPCRKATPRSNTAWRIRSISAALARGLFGDKYLVNEGDFSADERAHYRQLVAAASRAAETASTACIAAFTTTGRTAMRLARERPLQPTLALTPNLHAARMLALVWGVEARVVPQVGDAEELAKLAVDQALAAELARPNQRVIILAGLPMGSPGAANILRIAHAPRR